MDLAQSEYANRARNLMKMASALRDVGTETHIDIPRIAVIGGQSAGKSSLVEGVSGIRVPRSSGTCTRCPMEVNLRRQPGQWTCQIALRFEFDPEGKRLRQTHRTLFGSPILSPDGMEICLMRAQVAVLNYPGFNPDKFLRMSESELNKYKSREAFENGTLKFSKNTVCVEISDPECTDLSFVDLPGLIQNDSKETIDLVENLVKSVIQDQCLILVAVPMSDDIENQGSMRLAHEVDPDRVRTIGVLTKPDTVSAGDTGKQQAWRCIMDGTDNAHALNLGYYCVKLADDNERAQVSSRQERQRREENYFSSTFPWPQYPHRGQLGVRNLVTNLSKHLVALLDKVMPGLLAQANVHLSTLQQQLSAIPPPVENADATTEVLHRLDEFCNDLNRSVSGVDVTDESILAGIPSYVLSNRTAYRVLKKAIRGTAPDFRPYAENEGHERVSYDDDDQCENDDASERTAVEPDNKSDAASISGSVESWRQGVDTAITTKRRVYNLKDVRKVIEYSTSWELPDNVPYSAKKVLIDTFVRAWKAPTLQCYNGITARLDAMLNAHVTKNFGQFPKLREYIRAIVKELAAEQKEFARLAVENTLLLEEDAPYAPYTQNTEYLGAGKGKWATRLNDARVKGYDDPNGFGAGVDRTAELAQAFGVGAASLHAGLRKLVEWGHDNLSASDLMRMAPNQYARELEVMAEVRAYFDVSYKRVIDNVPLTIESALNRTLSKTIKTKIVRRLNLKEPGTVAHLDELLREDPEVEERRKDLHAKIVTLDEVLANMRGVDLT